MSGVHDPHWDKPGQRRGEPADLTDQSSITGDLIEGGFAEGGVRLTLDRDELGFWAKITGRSGKLYSWVQVCQDPTGTNWITAPGGAQSGGVGGPFQYNAYERNAATNVPNGTFVWMRRTTGLGGQAFEFSFSAAGGPQVRANITLSAGTTHDLALNGASWLVVTTSSSNSAIDGIVAAPDGTLIDVTNDSANDVKLIDASGSSSAAANQFLCPTSSPPTGNTGAPAYNVLHRRETVWLKYDASYNSNQGSWRIFERQPFVITTITPPATSATTEIARSRIRFNSCCMFGTWATDDATTDTVDVTLGCTGTTENIQVTTPGGTATLHFLCGVYNGHSTP